MKRQRPTSYWDDIANASNTLAKLTEQQTQHMELVKQIEKVTGKNIYEHNMSKWWDTICKKVKKCHDDKIKFHALLKEKIEEDPKDVETIVLELAEAVRTYNHCETQMRRWCRIIGATKEDDIVQKTASWTKRFRAASNKTNEQYTVTFKRWLDISRRLEAQT